VEAGAWAADIAEVLNGYVIVVRAQAGGLSVPVTGDLFLQLISIRTDVLLRDVAVLDAYFCLFLLAGIALLYLTLPRPLVMRDPAAGGAPGGSRRRGGGGRHACRPASARRAGTVVFDRQDSLGHAIRGADGEVVPHQQQQQQHPGPGFGSFTVPGRV
jgi:hypothetical protein